jgi:SAM-dependent methyltransferase
MRPPLHKRIPRNKKVSAIARKISLFCTMHQRLKSLLQAVNLYHPVQTTYRSTRSFLSRQYYRLTYAKYRGKGFVCNFCNTAYEKFIPEYPSPDIENAIYSNNVIAGFGENVICPHCASTNRERLILDVTHTYIDINNKKILHFSPEPHLSRYLRQTAKVTSVDITPGFYRHIDKAVTYADATRLPFNDNSFEVAIANHILEHIPDDQKAMKEIYRVLKTGGVAILQVPYSETIPHTLEEPSIADPIRQAARFGQRDHVRIYALNDYTARLKKAGFRVRLLTPDMLTPFRIHAIQEKETVILGYKH